MVEQTAVGEHQQDELARLRTEIEIAEARRKLGDVREPWWRSGSTVTGIVGLLAAIVPVTSGIQSCVQKQRDLATAQKAQEQQVRDRYLDSIVKDPRNAQVVLRFVEATTDDPRTHDWAKKELVQLDEQVGILDRRHRSEVYHQAIEVVARLANSENPGATSDDLTRFWELYNVELLGIESSDVESLMVKLGLALTQCKDKATCKRDELQDLSFRLARKVRDELAAPVDTKKG